MNFIDKDLENYCINHSNTPDNECSNLFDNTVKNSDMSVMLAGPLENSLIEFFIRSKGIKTILEIGTFTGYSTLNMAKAIPENGVVYTLDIDEAVVKTAYPFWKKSKVIHKIKSIIGSALDFFDNNTITFDLIFIDADKKNYLNYLKKSLKILSRDGIIIIDNCLWSGKVMKNEMDEDTKAISDCNKFVKESTYLFGTLLPIRDGVFLIQKIK